MSRSALSMISETLVVAQFRCTCGCGCPIKHLRSGICALCRDGDHWTRIQLLLDQLERGGRPPRKRRVRESA